MDINDLVKSNLTPKQFRKLSADIIRLFSAQTFKYIEENEADAIDLNGWGSKAEVVERWYQWARDAESEMDNVATLLYNNTQNLEKWYKEEE